MKINNFFSSLICNWKNMRARYPVVMDSGLSDSGLYGVSPIPIPPLWLNKKKTTFVKWSGRSTSLTTKTPCTFQYTASRPTAGTLWVCV